MQLSTRNSMIRIGFFLISLLCLGITQLLSQQPVLPKLLTSEKVFVHTDKNDYIAGEILWFRPYLIKEAPDSTHNYNHIIYAELINGQGTPVLQSKIALKDASTGGNFYLPTDLATGVYTLVAYTTDMKNVGPPSFFKKRILITNTLNAPLQPTLEKPEILLQFFPEGGPLIQNTTSRIGVQALDPATMKGIEVKGFVLADGKDTVTNFFTEKFGLGQFNFTPLTGKKYSATIFIQGKAIANITLPNAQPSGYHLGVTGSNSSYSIKIQSKNKTPEKLYLIAHDGQANKVVKAIQEGISEDIINIDKAALGTGVVYFTLFNEHFQPLCERLVFIPLLPDKKTLTITSNKPVYDSRENTTLAISGGESSIDASVSVFKETGDCKEEPMWIYLSLTRHLQGTIEDPQFYFTPEAMQHNYIDNLMLTHGWRQFRNRDTSPPAVTEFDGHIISARVKDSWSKAPVPGAPCLLSVPSVPYGLYFGTSDSTGIVRFIVNGYYGPGDIFVTPIPLTVNAKPNYIIEIINPFADSATERSFTQPPLYLQEADSAILLKRSVAMQATHIYHKDQLRRFHAPAIADTLPFYGKAEFKYNLDDYKRFSTMEEVLREYVTPINVLAKGGQLRMSFFDEKYQTIYSDGFLVLLDGVPLFDYNKIFSYNPYKVKKLEVIPRRYIFGSVAFSGIASFETYNSKFDGFELDPAAIAIDYEGLQIQREFYLPDYSRHKGNIRIPDYRTTLLWQPSLALQKGQVNTLNYSTSDITGKYKVVIQGISKEGIPYYGENTFEVK
ncbi:hypothetical protein ACLOAU_22720 [Niabella sp. CJ426]|uniref:hypothetical protein n=1 Tax=Niabella sp. CJ426 TaxID=3393740 RepID=UPI003D01A5B4